MDESKKELIVELDFHGAGGIAPALQILCPEFKVGLTKDYLEGNRRDLPDWFKT